MRKPWVDSRAHTAGMTYVPGPPPPGWPVPATPRRRGLPGWAIALIIGGVVVVLLCIAGAVLLAVNLSAPKPYVSVIRCESVGGGTTVTYLLRNRDTKPHNYVVRGTAGNSPTAPDSLVDVQPGQTVTGHLEGFGTGTCRITSVDQR